MPSKLIVFLFGFILTGSVFAASPIEDYNASKTYSTGALVLEGQNSYIMSGSGTSLGQAPASNPAVWTDLSVAATALEIPTDEVPDLSTDTILNSLPGAAPSGSGSLSGGKLLNLSTRGYVGDGTQRLIGGFKVYGGTCKILVRAFGPSRANSDNLDNPYLTWKTNPTSLLPSTSGIVSEVGDASSNSRLSGQDTNTTALINALISLEEADIQTISNWDDNYSSGYTAFITPETGTSPGVGRIGINDVSDGSGGQLINISTRGYVGSTSAQYLIAGFQIRDGSVSVCIRAFGPSRTVSDALSDPIIELIQQVSAFHSVKSTIAMNDDYQSDFSGVSTESGESVTTAKASSIPTYLNNLITKEAAIIMTLPPGDYTARVYGVNGAVGIGRVGIDKVIE
ncbi:hypothetical protein OAK38_06615 [Verrucomicrobia bacterium]|nr:hypothetical protein [Verrucomicrobiota bacterium]